MKTFNDLKKDVTDTERIHTREVSIPIGYFERDTHATLSTCSRDMFGSVIVADRNSSVLESYIRSMLSAVNAANVDVSIDNIYYSNSGERDKEIVRKGKFGDSEIELNTYREMAAFVNGVRMDIERRLYNINLLGCKTWYEYNDTVKQLAGRRMTAEQQWCFNNRNHASHHITWESSMTVTPNVYVLNNVIDYMENPAFSCVLIEPLDYILKHSGAAGICFIMTISELNKVSEYLRSSFHYNVLIDDDVQVRCGIKYVQLVFQDLMSSRKPKSVYMPI